MARQGDDGVIEMVDVLADESGEITLELRPSETEMRIMLDESSSSFTDLDDRCAHIPLTWSVKRERCSENRNPNPVSDLFSHAECRSRAGSTSDAGAVRVKWQLYLYTVCASISELANGYVRELATRELSCVGNYRALPPSPATQLTLPRPFAHADTTLAPSVSRSFTSRTTQRCSCRSSRYTHVSLNS
jgi:hypothetical protein